VTMMPETQLHSHSSTSAGRGICWRNGHRIFQGLPASGWKSAGIDVQAIRVHEAIEPAGRCLSPRGPDVFALNSGNVSPHCREFSNLLAHGQPGDDLKLSRQDFSPGHIREIEERRVQTNRGISVKSDREFDKRHPRIRSAEGGYRAKVAFTPTDFCVKLNVYRRMWHHSVGAVNAQARTTKANHPKIHSPITRIR